MSFSFGAPSNASSNGNVTGFGAQLPTSAFLTSSNAVRSSGAGLFGSQSHSSAIGAPAQPSATAAASTPRMSEIERAALKAQLTDPTDFKITIDCYTWAVHSSRFACSEFFKKLLDGSFSESQSKTVTLHDDDPKNIARLIIWFYYRDYDIHDSRNGFGAPSVSEMLDSGSAQYQASLNKSPSVPPSQTGLPTRTEMFDVHTEMFIIADKYAISDLTRYCITQFKTTCAGRVACVWLLEKFHQSLEGLGIKADDVNNVIEDEILGRSEAYMNDPKLKERVAKNPEFAWRLIQKLAPPSNQSSNTPVFEARVTPRRRSPFM